MTMLRGRMNRATYWIGLAVFIVVYGIINISASKPMPVSEVVLIFLCIPRLHDLGKSGWWVLLPFSLEIGAAIVAFTTFTLEEAAALMGVVVLVIVGMLIWLGSVAGETGANRFGEPPAPGLQFKRVKST